MTNDRDRSPSLVPPSTQDRIKGALSAPVVLVMYGDYECFQSANLYRLIEAAQQQLNLSFEKDLCFIFRHFPHVRIHPHAQHAAEAAEAAEAQSQFWQMHEMLLIYQQELGNGYLVEYANRLGLDIPQFLQDLSRRVHVERINRDIESGHQSGVEVAPALFVNGIRYTNRWNLTQINAAITKSTN